MLSVDLSGGREAGERFLDRLTVAVHATSLGSVETLCSHPASSSHRQLSEEELAQAGLTPGMVRISIGLEDPDDLVADLTAAAAPETTRHDQRRRPVARHRPGGAPGLRLARAMSRPSARCCADPCRSASPAGRR